MTIIPLFYLASASLDAMLTMLPVRDDTERGVTLANGIYSVDVYVPTVNCASGTLIATAKDSGGKVELWQIGTDYQVEYIEAFDVVHEESFALPNASLHAVIAEAFARINTFRVSMS